MVDRSKVKLLAETDMESTQDSRKVRVAALLYQWQKELLTPRMYSYIGEVDLQLSLQRLNVLITTTGAWKTKAIVNGE